LLLNNHLWFFNGNLLPLRVCIKKLPEYSSTHIPEARHGKKKPQYLYRSLFKFPVSSAATCF
jgi:hypothetical protein